MKLPSAIAEKMLDDIYICYGNLYTKVVLCQTVHLPTRNRERHLV